MKHPGFRPSIAEQPVLRIRFLDPDGQEQQATIASTWVQGFQAGSLFQAQNNSGTTRLASSRDSCIDCLHRAYEAVGCTILGIESISTKVSDFLPA